MINKKIIGITTASALLVALGVTVAAGNMGISSRDGEPNETVSIPVTCVDEKGNEYPGTISHDVKKVYSFETKDSCNEIEFKTNYVPGYYDFLGGEFGDPNSWNSFLQGESSKGCFNVEVFYTPSFGPEGGIYLPDEAKDEKRGTMGDYETLEFTTDLVLGYANFDEFKDYYEEIGVTKDTIETYKYYTFMMYHPDGYVISLTGSESMDVLKKMAENIEVRKTDKVVEYNPDFSYKADITRGVG